MKMPLGKFEGTEVSDLPDWYLEYWSTRVMTHAPLDVRRAMTAELNRRVTGVVSESLPPTPTDPFAVPTRHEPPPRRKPGVTFTVAQLSDYLGVPPRTLYRWRRDKSFPRPIFEHGKPRYSKPAVDVWLTTRGLVGAVC